MPTRTGAISLQEIILFLSFNVCLIIIGIVLWYFVWIRQYGGEIPNPQLSTETNISFFSTKNFGMLISQVYQHIKKFDKSYFIRSVGVEGYIYLKFQRALIALMITYICFALIFSGIGMLFKERYNQSDWITEVQNFFMNNKYLNDYTTIMHVIAISLYTFMHFRCFAKIRREALYLYFERFDKMSREKNADWIACRTLHISGIGPNERNSKHDYL